MSNIYPKHFKQSEIYGLRDRLILMLDQAREIAGVPFIITSGLRTADQNRAVGGVSDSAHLKGLAVDLQCKNSNTRFKIVKSLLEVGFNRIEIAPLHIHTDIDNLKPKEVIFFK